MFISLLPVTARPRSVCSPGGLPSEGVAVTRQTLSEGEASAKKKRGQMSCSYSKSCSCLSLSRRASSGSPSFFFFFFFFRLHHFQLNSIFSVRMKLQVMVPERTTTHLHIPITVARKLSLLRHQHLSGFLRSLELLLLAKVVPLVRA